MIVTQFGVPVEKIRGYDKKTGNVFVWLKGDNDWRTRNIMNLKADGGLTEIMETIEGETETNYNDKLRK